MSTRRSFLATASTTMAFPLFGQTLHSRTPEAEPNIRPSSAVLEAVTSHISRLGAKISLHQVTQSDVLLAKAHVELLSAHFKEIKLDEHISAALKKINSASVDWQDSPIVDTVHQKLKSAGATYDRESVRRLLVDNMSADRRAKQLSELQDHGVTPVLDKLSIQLSATLRVLPVSTDAPANLVLVEGSVFCWYLNWVAGLLGIATFELGLGCLPIDPVFVFICPIVAVLAIIAAVVAALAFVVC